MSKPILSAFADEYKKDFDGQLEGLNGFGINYMELRFVGGTNVAMLTPDEVKEVKDGKLADVAPTILKLMGIEQPAAMTGQPLV